MDEQDLDRFGAAAGVVASAAVGVPFLLATLAAQGPGPWWWVAYLGHLAAFLLINRPLQRRPPWLGDRPLLAVLVVAGSVAFLLAPETSIVSVLFVVTAAAAAFVVPIRVALLVLAVQTIVGAVATAWVVDSLDATISITLVYGAFQAFALVVVSSQQREGAARRELEAVNTELRTANALLDASSRGAERVRIARDLHDLIGHQLTALTLELEVASHHATAPSDEHVGRARSIAKQLLTSVREAVGDLRAPRLDLEATLLAVTDLARPQVHLDVDDQLEVDDDTRIALVRCVQEIVTNTVRHAEASNLTIVLEHGANGSLRLDAAGDGVGAPAEEPGNGLTGLRERIESLGGEVRFSTAPGRGS